MPARARPVCASAPYSTSAPGLVVGVLLALALDIKVLSVVFALFALAIAVRGYRMWREVSAAAQPGPV